MQKTPLSGLLFDFHERLTYSHFRVVKYDHLGNVDLTALFRNE
jgi:hypothetical protein